MMNTSSYKGKRKHVDIRILAVFVLFLGTLFCLKGTWVQAKDTEVDLYALSSTYQEYIQIADEYAQEYTLPNADYKVVSGESVTIEGNVVRPKVEIEYGYQAGAGYWIWSTYPSGVEGEITRSVYTFGDAVVQSADGTDTITFHVVDYSYTYSQNVMKDYLAEHVQEGMTDYEKADLCCRFVAENYDYGTGSSSYRGMIITGSGDCWASTGALLYMLNELGIPAAQRSARYDPGAGSGHYNVMAKLDDKYAILDAGYAGKKPRGYHIDVYSQPYSYYRTSQNTAKITRFINLEGIKKVNIPAEIDGYTVTAIGSGAFQDDKEVAEINIPDTVTYIGEYAFANNASLERIVIPSSVQELGECVFYFSQNLKSVTISDTVQYIGDYSFGFTLSLEEIVVDEGNPSYSSQDGVLYDKKKEKLIVYPASKPETSFIMPNSVKEVCSRAFVNVSGLKELTLSTALVSMGEDVFYACNGIEKLVIPEGITRIEPNAFQECTFKEIVLPSTLKSIGERAFYKANFTKINLPEGLETIEDGAFMEAYGNANMVIPKSVKSIGSNAFNRSAEFNFGDAAVPTQFIMFAEDNDVTLGVDVFDTAKNTLIGVSKDTAAYQYVVKNNLPYIIVNENKKLTLQEDWFYLNQTSMSYQGDPLQPLVIMDRMAVPYLMREGVDYEVEYLNNVNPGTATVSIKGIGLCDGTVTKTFKIIQTGNIFILGDVNGDKEVDLDDALMTLRAALQIIKLTDEQSKAANVDHIGDVTLEDALLVLRAALRIINLE